ncbi:MAG TPA: M14 family metallopeptidase [Gemmatimonadaceae bacterium]|nr:M14 family metallopeptidase [Gemmatimonadaceae bacterium]
MPFTTRWILLAAVASLPACAASGPRTTGGSQSVAAYPPRDLQRATPKTRAERSNFTETSSYADVVAFIDSLKAMSKDIHVGTFGRASSGRDIPMVILSRPVVRTAAEAKRLHRPIVWIQGNIHGGEVEGKEALLSALRDLARDPYANVVDSVVIVAVPIYNIDGNDSLGAQEQNRPAQQGPARVGRRANGQGLDLNRDYIKAEAPETRASLDFIREWEPDVFVDLHTTNGSYHGYALTWAPPLNPAARFSGPFTRDTVLPALRASLKENLRIETFPYGNFASQDSIERGWFTYDHRPRFGTNYFGLRGRVGILSEAYSHDPFARRVASTYSFVVELLSLIAGNAEDFIEVGREADRRTTAFATTTNASPAIPIRSRLTTTPRVEPMLVEEVVPTGDSARTEAGLRPGLRRTGKVRSVRVPIFDRFEPVLQQTLPYAYAISAEQAPVLEHLRRHGVFVEQLSADARLPVERFTIDSVTRAARPFQGHQEVSLSGRWVSDTVSLAAGTYIVRGGQPMGILALYLLEPQSDDGLTTWNVMDPWIQPGGRYPIIRVVGRIDAPLRNIR